MSVRFLLLNPHSNPPQSTKFVWMAMAAPGGSIRADLIAGRGQAHGPGQDPANENGASPHEASGGTNLNIIERFKQTMVVTQQSLPSLAASGHWRARAFALCHILQEIVGMQEGGKLGWKKSVSLVLEWKECVGLSGVLGSVGWQLDREFTRIILDLYAVAQTIAMMAEAISGEEDLATISGSLYLGVLEPPDLDELEKKAIPIPPSPKPKRPQNSNPVETRPSGSISSKDIPHVDGVEVISVPPLNSIDPDGHVFWVTSPATRARYYAQNWPKPLPKIPVKYVVKEVGGDMGIGVFATQDIKKFEPVLLERPYLVYPQQNRMVLIDALLARRLSPNQLFQLNLKKMEEFYSPLVNGLMDEKSRQDFMSLANSHKHDGSGPIVGIVRTNGFAIQLGQKLPGLDKDFVSGYGAIGRVACRLNHSCVADVLPGFDPVTFTIRFFASRDIKAGSQIFTTYTPSQETKAQRQKRLESYEFKCHCHSCTNWTPQSDKVRANSRSLIQNWMNQANNVWMKDNQLKEDVLEPLLEAKRTMEEEGLDHEMHYPYLLEIMEKVYRKVGNSEKSRQCIDELRTNAQGWSRALGWASGDIEF